MSAAVKTRAQAKQESNAANGVEQGVDHKRPDPTVDGGQQQCRKTQLTTDNDTNSANANGMTPLMRAAGDGLVDFVQVLLDRGADVNAKRNDGFSALALAAFFGHSQVVRLLLVRGADVEATTRLGTSAEIWADARGFIGIGDLLRETRESKPPQEPAPLPAVLQEHPRFPRPVAEERREEVGIVKTLPDILDRPRIIAPEFHPGSVFVARISSSWKNQAALVIVVLIACGIATLAVPQIVRVLTAGQTEAVTNTTDLPEASNNPVAQPEERVSSQIETPLRRRLN